MAVFSRRLRLAGRLLLLMLSPALFAGWADTWEGLRAGTGEIRSVTARFVQEKHLKILKKPLISEGVFYFQAPDALRWEYASPIQSILLMHGGSTRRFVGGPDGFKEDDSARLQAMQVVLDQITAWLSGSFDDNPQFQAVLSPGRTIVLTPREPALAGIIEKIVLELSDRPGVIDHVKIYEGEDSYTRLSFKDVRLNDTIDAAVFQEIR